VNPIHPALAPLAAAAIGKKWAEVDKALAAALRRPAWLRPEHRIGDPTGYMRHLLFVDAAGPFVITAITWLPGQRSPLHGHQVWCAYGVAEGELTEEQFVGADGVLRQTKSSVVGAGELADRDLHGKIIHRVANRGSRPLVSLHLYGVAPDRLTTGINRIYER
jgi:3-mercaptopropionate dioxygenase